MATTFEKCPKEVGDLASKLISDHRPDLAEADPNIAFLFASNETGPAIVIGGQQRTDKVRVVPLRDRANGLPDAQILIDESWWREAAEGEQAALIDRTLMHLRPVLATEKDCENGNNTGRYKTDDLGRPVLKFRHCDYMASGFYDTIERHPEAATELKQLKTIGAKVRELTQLVFWG